MEEIDYTYNLTATTTTEISSTLNNKRDQILEVSSIVIVTLYIIVMVISIPGNLLIIWIIASNKRLKNSINLLVCNLAVAGILIGIVRMPIKIYELTHYTEIYYHYPFSNFTCKLNRFVPACSIMVISITLTTICIDRYVSIVYPLKPHLKLTCRRVYLFLPCCWLISGLLSIPFVMFVNVIKFSDFKRCHLVMPTNSNTTGTSSNNLHFTFANIIPWAPFILSVFLIPVIIMAILYSIMVKKLWYSAFTNNAVGIESQEYKSRMYNRTDTFSNYEYGLKMKRKVVKIFIAFVILFIATNLPYYVFFILVDFDFVLIKDIRNRMILVDSFIILNYTCIAYNAIIYGYFNSHFRSHSPKWLRLLCNCFKPIRVVST
ncbi:Neuromedin-K receptor [Trichoplax sp. H2]|nr:Neuromedin-K receptor [Trichoplax sp. H2]|eukprot:RDD42474.1 Neuromedin-K receptor [Trichoplax sp. H2]